MRRRILPFGAKSHPKDTKEYEDQIRIYLKVYQEKFSKNDPGKRVPIITERINNLLGEPLNLNFREFDWKYVRGDIDFKKWNKEKEEVIKKIQNATFMCEYSNSKHILTLQENWGVFQLSSSGSLNSSDERVISFDNVVKFEKGGKFGKENEFIISIEEEEEGGGGKKEEIIVKNVDKETFFSEFEKIYRRSIEKKAFFELEKRGKEILPDGSTFKNEKIDDFLTFSISGLPSKVKNNRAKISIMNNDDIEVESLGSDSSEKNQKEKNKPEKEISDRSMKKEEKSSNDEKSSLDYDSDDSKDSDDSYEKKIKIVKEKQKKKESKKKTVNKTKNTQDIELEDQNVLEIEEPKKEEINTPLRVIKKIISKIFNKIKENKLCKILSIVLPIIIVVVLLVVIVVITVIIVFSSLETVPMFKLGILRNTVTNKTVTSKAYGPGLYWVGPYSSFLLLPARTITVDFSSDTTYTSDLSVLETRSNDGMIFEIEVSYQYIIIEEKAIEIFNSFVTRFEQFFIDISIEIINDVVSKYDSIEFFSNRYTIANDMEATLKERFLLNGVTLISLQLNDVIIGEEYETAIKDKEYVKINTEKLYVDREYDTTNAEVTEIVSGVQKNATIILSEAKAKAKKIMENADAEYYKITENARIEEMQITKTDLGLNTTELYKYNYIMDFYHEKAVEIPSIINMRTPAIIKGT